MLTVRVPSLRRAAILLMPLLAALILCSVSTPAFAQQTAGGEARLVRQVGVTRLDHVGHWVAHLRIVTSVWPTSSMRHNARPRNMLHSHIVRGIV